MCDSSELLCVCVCVCVCGGGGGGGGGGSLAHCGSDISIWVRTIAVHTLCMSCNAHCIQCNHNVNTCMRDSSVLWTSHAGSKSWNTMFCKVGDTKPSTALSSLLA